jgi:N-acetylmuramoyl-L-alanine amidase
MPEWKGIVNQSFTPVQFDKYCRKLQWTEWQPSFIVLHNTGSPSLTDRPSGFTNQHMLNLEHYYKVQQGWTAGPHLFVDDRRIWAFTPLTSPGTHSPSWNKLTLGIEMLGNYDKDVFDKGRGLKVQRNTIAAMASLCAVLKLDPQEMRLHREDPLTTHACPGSKVMKAKMIQQVQELLMRHHREVRTL